MKKSLIRKVLVLFIFSLHQSSVFAGIIDDAITHCDHIRQSNNPELPLSESFIKRFESSRMKALGQCQSLHNDNLFKFLTLECEKEVNHIMSHEGPKSLTEWNQKHFELVKLFTIIYKHHRVIPSNSTHNELAQSFEKNKLAKNYEKSLRPSQDGEYCPVAVFDKVSIKSLGKAFANHTYPLGVSLNQITEFDGSSGDPVGYFTHDILHASTHIAPYPDFYNLYSSQSTNSNSTSDSAIEAKEKINPFSPIGDQVTIPEKYLKALIDRRKNQSEFFDSLDQYNSSYHGKACSEVDLYQEYFQNFHEASSIIAFETDCSQLNENSLVKLALMKKRKKIPFNPNELTLDDPQWIQRNCFCMAWNDFKKRKKAEELEARLSFLKSAAIQSISNIKACTLHFGSAFLEACEKYSEQLGPGPAQ